MKRNRRRKKRSRRKGRRLLERIMGRTKRRKDNAKCKEEKEKVGNIIRERKVKGE